MDVGGILRGMSPSAISSRGDDGEKEQPAAVAAPPQQPAGGGLQNTAALREILARYDVTNISPREFSELAQSLREAGVISEEDFQELATIRLELDQNGVEPDGPLNLVDFFQEKLQQQEDQIRRLEQKQGAPIDRADALRATLRQIDWIQKFTLINSAAEYEPLDALV